MNVLQMLLVIYHHVQVGSISITHNVKYMASSRTKMLIRITNINKQQIASKKPDTAICYIHC
jgi:hypothetical protein